MRIPIILTSLYCCSRRTYKRGQKFRILSIDGGGAKGLAPIIVLEHLEKVTGKRIHELFDLIAGTSVGAILATRLTIPSALHNGKSEYTATQVREKSIEANASMFKRNRWSIFGSKYIGESKRASIEAMTKNYKITDLVTDIIVPSYDTLEGISYYFRSKCAVKNPKCNYNLTDVCDASSAAPTYFPPVYVEGHDSKSDYLGRNFVDGALVTNSPVMVAISHAIKDYGVDINDIVVLSLGTGKHNKYNSKQDVNNWGLIDWARNLPGIFISSAAESNNYQAEHILKRGQFLRLDFNIIDPARDSIDDISEEAINFLTKKGNEMFTSNKYKINQFLNHLK